MDSQEDTTLHMLFFPFMAPGHMLPMLDIAKLFSARSARCTVLTTPANAALIRSSLDRHAIQILVIPFPSVAAGLPDGCENLYSVPSPELEPNFIKATGTLREPFRRVLDELLPDCVVTDMFLPWAYHAADELDVPTLMFTGLSFFAHCCFDSMAHNDPLGSLPAGEESFAIPGLPHNIKMFKSQILNLARDRPDILEVIVMSKEVERRCYGMVMNTFYELEPDYSKHYREVVGGRAWHLGPVSLCNSDATEKSSRGNSVSDGYESCLSWLDTKSPGSVVYVCFGSGCHFSTAQLREIALGLEAAKHPFIWVVRPRGEGEEEESWMPEGYEERIAGEGLVLRGWAPQIAILSHGSVGGFVTHCGWNSTLEGVSAGLPLATWPQFADQFFNERLIVDVLRVGVAVGVRSMAAKHEERELVGAAGVQRAVRRLMGSGDDGEERRHRARELGRMAKEAVGSGGSSRFDLDSLVHELKERRIGKMILK
ncbi:scopoletin glucosyltransferase-like [Iris pallida]|uniref:Glycosyltransferase n=1 Tax=Iris pallida TaxID=29817 RepID=A0AAX6GYK1_IRIPA|nr:scopoletin glucosyltransferase-like [Iris pallida]